MIAEWPSDYGRHVLDTVDSTNAEAMRIAPDTSAPTWVLAYHQTAGKGRRGREWVSPPGNFFATLLMRPKGDLRSYSQRSFVAALALQEALTQVTEQPSLFTLKWPNDVLMKDQKVAGILLETVQVSPKDTALCIGIGVNLASAPEPSQLEARSVPPTSVAQETGITVQAEEFLAHLAKAYQTYEGQLVTHGFAPIRAAWMMTAARKGREITAKLMHEEIKGVFEGIDDTGALVLNTDNGPRTLPAADIYFDGDDHASGH